MSGSATDELVRRLADHAPAKPRYKLEREVARGGMGAILKVYDEDLGRHLAMKVELGTGEATRSGATPPVDGPQLARFIEEAQVTGQLDHPGIVPVHELGLDEQGRVFFTMKLVTGRDLQHVFDLVFARKEGWNETRALNVILKACEAMAYAHAKGVIHRDLKPSNVMVGNFGEVYVMDWGLARVINRERSQGVRITTDFDANLESVKTVRTPAGDAQAASNLLTESGAIMGTVVYMPPEQAWGEIEKLGPRSDVYSMGAMLYHLLARHAPYRSPAEVSSTIPALEMVQRTSPAALSSLRRDVPAELVAICEKAMARDAAQRYSDTSALANDLRAFLENRVVGAYETGPWAEARKWVKRNKPLAAALAAAVALLVAGLTTSLVFKSQADNQAKIAKTNETLATQKANDVLSLSSMQDLQDLILEADSLWPALPDKVAQYEAWLERARVLIDGRVGDPNRGIKAHPGIADHERTLALLEERELKQGQQARFVASAPHPRAKELEEKRARAQWMNRMLGNLPWPKEEEVEAQLAQNESARSSARRGQVTITGQKRTYNPRWPVLDEYAIGYGEEVEALVRARRSVQTATDSDRHLFRDLLAWALYRTGRLDEALAEIRKAFEETPPTDVLVEQWSMNRVEMAVAAWKNDPIENLRARRGELAELEDDISNLEREVNRPSDLLFEDGEERWWHSQLRKLVLELKDFSDKNTGLFSTGLSRVHGWGVGRRLDFAKTTRNQLIEDVEAKRHWNEAITAIASNPVYKGMRLEPQLGLVPIGPDPQSHLWEFAHLASGRPCQRGTDGRLILTEDIGVVLVLVPGGSFLMGAQKDDPSGHNYDPFVNEVETPVHEVTLSPFLMAKYELTQGQWERMTGWNPAHYGPGGEWFVNWNRIHIPPTLLSPVESISWDECAAVLPRFGLVLPTEAQWEYAARAGTETPWWVGVEESTLSTAGNIADAWWKDHGGANSAGGTMSVDDGYGTHSPVGSLAPNAYGLYDVIGNVREWCHDSYGGYGVKVEPGTGERLVEKSLFRVYRGGGWGTNALSARSARRAGYDPAYRDVYLGVRPAMRTTP